MKYCILNVLLQIWQWPNLSPGWKGQHFNITDITSTCQRCLSKYLSYCCKKKKKIMYVNIPTALQPSPTTLQKGFVCCPEAHNKRTQPCITLNVPIYTNTRSGQPRVPWMCPLFCSGAGMCGTGWHRRTGQLTAGTGCWSNWTWPQRDEFPSNPVHSCPPAPPPSTHLGTMAWLYSHKVFNELRLEPAIYLTVAPSTHEKGLFLFAHKLPFGYLTPLTFSSVEH